MKKKNCATAFCVCVLTISTAIFGLYVPRTNANGETTPPSAGTSQTEPHQSDTTAPATTAPATTVPATTVPVTEKPTEPPKPTEPVTEKPTEPPKPTEPATEKPAEPPRVLPKGDADGDGKVTVADARILLRCAVGLEKVPEGKLKQWDIKENGVIDLADARAALRVAIGLPPDGPSYVKPTKPAKPTEKQYAESLASKVAADKLNATMKMLCADIGTRYVGSQKEKNARNAIVKYLENCGYTPSFQDVSVGSSGIPSKNILVTIPTKKQSPDIYLFSAHYDCSEMSVGAVDNASGVSALLELARILKAEKRDFGCEIRIAFFAGEEKGFYGAYRYRRSMSDSERSRHKIFFNVDMAGHSTDGNKNYLCISTEPVIKTYSAVKKTAYDNLGSLAAAKARGYIGNCGEDAFFSPVSAGTHDIVPFRKAGLPALTLSWREIHPSRGAGNDRNLAPPAVIHTSRDNLSNFDSRSLYLTTRLVAASFAVMTYGYVY